MKKINVGAGGEWQSDGWDVLDNGPSNYGEPWNFEENVGKLICPRKNMTSYFVVICLSMCLISGLKKQ